MSLTEGLVVRLCTSLCRSLMTVDERHHWRLAQWLRMPLPKNEYWHLVATRSPVPAVESQAKRARLDASYNTQRLVETMASERTRQTQAHGASAMQSVEVVDNRRSVMTSVDAALSDERALALRMLEDATSKRFDFSQPGVIPKITQLLLVLALEPCSLTLEFVLRRRFDDEFVVRNLTAGAGEPMAPGDASVWQRDVKCMSFNLFGRFPELAIQCDSTSDVEQLRAIQDLWCVANEVFDKCSTTLHSERATDFLFNRTLDHLLGDRTELLCNVARANIYAGGTDPGRFTLRRDLFAEAFVCAQLHVLQLHARAPVASSCAARFRQTLDTLKAARLAIVAYVP
jgi:hypothetical protein